MGKETGGMTCHKYPQPGSYLGHCVYVVCMLNLEATTVSYIHNYVLYSPTPDSKKHVVMLYKT